MNVEQLLCPAAEVSFDKGTIVRACIYINRKKITDRDRKGGQNSVAEVPFHFWYISVHGFGKSDNVFDTLWCKR